MADFDVKIDAQHRMGGYIAVPERFGVGDTAPCVIMIQEIFGVNEGIRQKCDWLASQGFITFAPDLFWRFGAGIELSDHKEEELQQAFDYFGKFNVDQGVRDIDLTYQALLAHPNCAGEIGAVGYCLGGKLAYLTACRTDVKASVGYYGVGIETLLAEANTIDKSLMLHIAQKDGFVPPEAQEKIHQALDSNDNITLHDYTEMDHAFTRQGGDAYNAAMAKIADDRTVEFLNAHLKD